MAIRDVGVHVYDLTSRVLFTVHSFTAFAIFHSYYEFFVDEKHSLCLAKVVVLTHVLFNTKIGF